MLQRGREHCALRDYASCSRALRSESRVLRLGLLSPRYHCCAESSPRVAVTRTLTLSHARRRGPLLQLSAAAERSKLLVGGDYSHSLSSSCCCCYYYSCLRTVDMRGAAASHSRVLSLSLPLSPLQSSRDIYRVHIMCVYVRARLRVVFPSICVAVPTYPSLEQPR